MKESRDSIGQSILEQSSIQIDDMRPSPVEHDQFQELQNRLAHCPIMFASPHKLSYNEVIGEFLRTFSMAVVLDTQTSWSRTCWLSGSYEGNPVIAVVDSVKGSMVDYTTVDIWSNLKGISQVIQERLRGSLLANVGYSLEGISIDWDFGYKTETTPRLIVSIASQSIKDYGDFDIYVSIGYSTRVSEIAVVTVPLGDDVASVAIDLDEGFAEAIGSLDQAVFDVYITDADWKPLSKARKISVTWREVLERQIERKLVSETRFKNFEELGDALGLSFSKSQNSVSGVFFRYCLERTPEQRERHRIEDYCMRTTILTGLVTCFNPPRGLTGYLEMVSGDSAPQDIRNLGSRRTWREHISEVTNIADDFRPTPLTLIDSKKGGGRGRPPTHLMPRTPLHSLFMKFSDGETSCICANCRFHK